MNPWALGLIFGCVASLAIAQVEQPKTERTAILSDKRIHESSGLARSLRHPGVFWTHNDSGGEPCLFAINHQGQTLAKIRVPKAANFDWEDITQGLNEKGRPSLFIGDIGDNLKVRATLQIYQIPEPDLPKDATKEMDSAEPEIWHLSYPDGRHNAETLMMHPVTRRLYLLTKEEEGKSTLYSVPEKRVSGQGLTLEKITTLFFPARQRMGKRPAMASMTTGGDFSPDGRRLVIATYNYLHEWKLKHGEALDISIQTPSHLIEPPLTPQMEAICYDEDGKTLWITSEQLPTPLYRLQRN